MKQTNLFPKSSLAYGGDLLRTRRGRARNAQKIRALTAAIALAIGGRGAGRFWDRRPFSHVVRGRRGFLTVKDYVQINMLEELGFSRPQARAKLRPGLPASGPSLAGRPPG